MRTTRLLAVLVAALLLAAAAPSRAAIPRLINFQGRLADQNGVPLSGTYSIVFGVWSAATGGTACFTETQSVAVNAGLFNVNVGSATSGGVSASCTFAAAAYLELKVGTDAAMTPRLALTATGYAFNTDALDGVAAGALLKKDPTSNNVNVTGKLGVGVASPTQKLDVNGNVNATALCIGATCKTVFPAGTVTSISAGTGITLSPSPVTTTGTISVNTTTMQARVTGTCTGGIRVVASNGTVTCVTAQTTGTCQWGTRIYTSGAVCAASGGYGTYCTSGKYEFRLCTCNSNGTWSCSNTSCRGLHSSC
jgi:hypothetical protein